MGRKLLLINDLVRVYSDCSNPEKDRIVLDAINNIRALIVLPEVENES
jgi:hypothetical protein